jgi:hypothetical protein
LLPSTRERLLALFDRCGQAGYRGLDRERTKVDRLAFEIDVADNEAEMARRRPSSTLRYQT